MVQITVLSSRDTLSAKKGKNMELSFGVGVSKGKEDRESRAITI